MPASIPRTRCSAAPAVAQTPESFFAEFDAGLTALGGNIAGGVYDADPAQRALAEQTLAGGITFRDSLRAVVLDDGTASSFLPIDASTAGTTLVGRVTTLQRTLGDSLGVTSFVAPLPLPTITDVSFDTLAALARDPTGPYAYTSYIGQKEMGLGDVELGGAFTFIDTWDRGALGGVRLAAEALVRLPTGQKADPDVAFPAPLGDGQLDVQLQAAADIGRGNFGARITGGYLLQLASTVTRRVAPVGTLLVPLADRAEVSLDPGDELFIGIAPFIRLARPFALLVGVHYRHRSEDAATIAGGSVASVDPAVLGVGTSHSSVSVSAGLNYSEIGGRAGSRARTPVDAGWYWDMVIAGSGGRVASTMTVRMLVRLYAKLW